MENINCIRCGGTGLAKIPDDSYIDGFYMIFNEIYVGKTR